MSFAFFAVKPGRTAQVIGCGGKALMSLEGGNHIPYPCFHQQDRLFVPFTRLDQVQVKGHGLGLSIVRRIVEKLGAASA